MKKFSTAIIGCGNIAGGFDERAADASIWTHAKAYQLHGGFNLLGATDPDQKKLDHFCHIWKIPNFHKNWKQLFENESYNVVSICSPNSFHFQQLKYLLELESVKVILCEKPITLALEEAKEIEVLANSKNKMIFVNYLRRWDGVLSQFGNELLSPKYGSIKSGRVLYTKGVFHNASHAINLLQLWLGKCVGVQVHRSMEKGDLDLLADFQLMFKNNNNPSVAVEFMALEDGYNIFEMEIFTDLARIRFLGGQNIEIYERENSKLQLGEFSLSQPKFIRGTVHLAMGAVVGNLYDVLTENGKPKMQLHEAVETISICENIRNLAKGAHQWQS